MKPTPAFLLLLSFLAPWHVSPASAEPARPNILYIYVDDMGWGSIAPNGQEARRLAGQAHVLTPHLDQLAAQGVNFRRAYGCTVCSPARASQQTGFHQGHAYADRNDTDNARKAMRADDLVMGDVLAAAGYTTGFWGKWGFGASSDPNNPVLQNLQTLPNNHGYQHILAELHHVRAHTFFQPTLWSFAPGDSQIALVPNSIASYATADYPPLPARQNDAAYPATAYCDDFYSFRALDFVRARGQEYRDTGTPFFALLSVQIPHAPFGDVATLPQWDAAYAGNAPYAGLSAQSKQWCAMVNRIDGHIGNLLDALDDPNHDGDPSDSIAGNTLVIFQSDNGGPGDNSRTELDANGGLRGSKGSIWEGALRVPLLMRWPARIREGAPLEPGTSTDRVVDVTDLLPTFCELAGTPTPLGIDGISIAPTLTGDGRQQERDYIIHEAGSNHSIIRGKHKLVGPSNQLFDLEADPAETTDISGSNPALVAELSALMIGERVTEPQWFAATYHHWTGGDGRTISDASHWSDYVYQDLGGVYETDAGPPRPAWIARIGNDQATPNTARADADLDLLALEISGGGASQTLDLGGFRLSGRNGIRIGKHGTLSLDNGSIASLRRVEIGSGGLLTGAGSVEATVLNGGTVELTRASETTTPGPDVEVPGPDITLHDGEQFVANGGFESGTDTGGGDYSYATLSDWSTDGPDDSKDGAKPNSARSGTMRGLINGGSPDYPLVQACAFPVVDGDRYTLGFWHRGFSGWTTGETAEVRVFYENVEGSRVDLLRESFAMTNGTWVEATYAIPAVHDAAAVGRPLHVWLGPDGGTGFGSFDDVSLVRHGPEVTVAGPSITEPGPDIVVPGHRRLELAGDYLESGTATFKVTLAGATAAGEDFGRMNVAGRAELGGRLEVSVDPAFQPVADQVFGILVAGALSGTFNNADQVVTGSDGTRFAIGYSATTVTLTVVGTTAQGTPYDWLEGHGIDGGDPETADLIDHDGDGQLAWEEYVAGTDPNDPGSVFRAAAMVSGSGSGASLILSWPSVAGRLYDIEESAGLDVFDWLVGPFAATPPRNQHEIPFADDSRFFRVRVTIE